MSGMNYSEIYVYSEVQYPTLSKNANFFCRARRSLAGVHSGEFSALLLESNPAFAVILRAVPSTAFPAGTLNCVVWADHSEVTKRDVVVGYDTVQSVLYLLTDKKTFPQGRCMWNMRRIVRQQVW